MYIVQGINYLAGKGFKSDTFIFLLCHEFETYSNEIVNYVICKGYSCANNSFHTMKQLICVPLNRAGLSQHIGIINCM